MSTDTHPDAGSLRHPVPEYLLEGWQAADSKSPRGRPTSRPRKRRPESIALLAPLREFLTLRLRQLA